MENRSAKNYSFEELKKLVIGKKLSQTTEVDFGTCYPLVAKNKTTSKNPTIIGVVCAEFGSCDPVHGEWSTNGNVAWVN